MACGSAEYSWTSRTPQSRDAFNFFSLDADGAMRNKPWDRTCSRGHLNPVAVLLKQQCQRVETSASKCFHRIMHFTSSLHQQIRDIGKMLHHLIRICIVKLHKAPLITTKLIQVKSITQSIIICFMVHVSRFPLMKTCLHVLQHSILF